jgi:hypothetical protein
LAEEDFFFPTTISEKEEWFLVINALVYGLQNIEINLFKVSPVIYRLVTLSATKQLIKWLEERGVIFKHGVSAVEAIHENLNLLDKINFLRAENYNVSVKHVDTVIVKIQDCPYKITCGLLSKTGLKYACSLAIMLTAFIELLAGEYTATYAFKPLHEKRHCIITLKTKLKQKTKPDQKTLSVEV